MNDSSQPGEAEFTEWWPGGRERWISQSMSTHEFVRQAYLAGYEARSSQLRTLAYTPDSERADILRRFAPPSPYRATNFTPDGLPGDGSADYLPAPDYIQKGTITGRIPPLPVIDAPYSPPEMKLATSGILQEPITGAFPRRDPDKARRFAEAYGVQPVAGPHPETLERIHEKLTRDGVVEYPAPVIDTPPVGLEHTETVWDGDTTMQFGARGPVPTIPGLQEDENASS